MRPYPLTVYKASAGSGKTFTLAVEYIKLLISDPTSYRRILAVTFTNKATEEMKMRILSQLYGLANRYQDSRDYLLKICDELHVSEETVALRARQALAAIIHHYHEFRVETIDKFFQRVLRNLARELDLNANLRIELNDKQVEQQAVDQMINQLKNGDTILQWIMSYILKNIGDNNSWNVIKDVKKFGENIFKDAYKSHRDRMKEIMSDPTFFDDFRKKLYATRENCLKEMAGYAEDFFKLTKDYGVDDFNNKSRGVYGYFMKLRDGNFNGDPANRYVLACLENPQSWANKKSHHLAAITALAREQLTGLLQTAEEARQHCFAVIKTADVTLGNLYQLRLLIHIEEQIRALNQEANRFLLSDTQNMLHDLIEDSDTPFIFERAGTQLHHIMIDEFQDTGRVQWENFKILLRDCMDHGYSNLIVGDVKQSIYRWRSGDWRLLNGIRDEIRNDRNELLVKKLDTNYRSSRRVVTFNNAFFQAAAQLEFERLKQYVGGEAEELRTAYSDVSQEIPSKRGDTGYVRVELLTEGEYQSHIMERISEIINTLTALGVRQDQIAILARSNREISDTALYFQENEPSVRIVSDEAFRLDASLAVDMLVTSLRLLIHPEDRPAKAALAKNYQKAILCADLTDDQLADTHLHEDGTDPLDGWLPESYAGVSQRQRLLSQPLNELVEALFEIFGLEKLNDQSAYVCTFYDHLNQFLSDNIGDVETFLDLWDDTLCSKTIQGDSVDGIRMVTIHKSKGLEYDHVIMPFCNWALEKPNTLWCDSVEHPFAELPILPVNYSKKGMIGTLYEDDFKREHLQNSVDNLNLLYVGFTRAKDSLFIIGQAQEEKEEGKEKDEKKDALPKIRSELIEKSLHSISNQLSGCVYEQQPDGSILLEYGTLSDAITQQEEKEKSKNVFLQKETDVPFVLHSQTSNAQFLQSNQSRQFTTDLDDGQKEQYIRRGTLLHSIFSQLRYLDDIDRVLSTLTQEGILYDEITPSELQELLRRAFANEQVRAWFSPHWNVHNECDILFLDKGKMISKRPDRVISDDHQIIVIDFKFGKPHKDHEGQVQLYMEQLDKMDQRTVSGYLWYVSLNMTQEVKPR